MIWGVGLPRCAGQTLQKAISILTGRGVWHSIEAHRWIDSIGPEDAGAVEIFAPLKWLADYPGGPHLFIHNWRDKESWIKSCEKVHAVAISNRWNHPIWRYPLDQFGDYYDEYMARINTSRVKIHSVNLIDNPRWNELCNILGLPIPPDEFPNQDLVIRGPVTESSFKPTPTFDPLGWI